MTADLHIHTSASDGRLSPQAIIGQAQQVGLKYIAITDHDTVDGLLSLEKESPLAAGSLCIIPGIEFSTDLPEHEVHILGYYIDKTNFQLLDELARIRNSRLLRARHIVDKLRGLGYDITCERVLEIAGGAAIGRPHIAGALVEKHYFSEVSQVFDELLYKNGPAYVPHYKLSTKQVIELISQAQGISILAHPGLIGNDALVLDVIKTGIQGLEVYHPSHNEQEIAKYLQLAAQHQLLVTGGSDFHAIPGRYPAKLGEFTVPAAIAQKLQKYARHETL